MEEKPKPSSSSDPRDASFSYTFADRADLWGPFCRECLTDWYDGNHFKDLKTHFYLHLKKCGRHYYLPELITLNGTQRPFDFHVIPDELRLLTCAHQKCKFTGKERPVKATTSTGMQTLPVRDEPKAQSVKNEIPTKPSALSSLSAESSEKEVTIELPKRGEIRRVLSKENPPYVVERRPVEFPLLFGTCYKMSSKVNEDVWILRTKLTLQIYEEMKMDMAAQLKEAFDQQKWKTIDCDVCPLIQPDQPYVEHVVSEYHRKNLYARGRWVTNGHFDMLDGFLRKQERVYRNQQNQQKQQRGSTPNPVASVQDRPATPPPSSSSALHFPLMQLWTSRHPDHPKISKDDYNAKLDSIKELLPLTNLQKLNEKFGANLDPKLDMCSFCSAKVIDLSDVVEHICSAVHRERAYNKFHVTVKDLNEYTNMLRAAAANKLPDRSSEVTLSRTPSTSSILSAASSKTSAGKSMESKVIRMPFVEGHDKPEQEMSRDEVVNVGIMTRGWFMDHPEFKKKLNEVVAKRGTPECYCAVCSKNMSGAVAVVEHALSTGHITQVLSGKRRFCRLYDFCPLVTILLDANAMSHPSITPKNAETYFNMLKNSLSSQVQQTVPVKTGAAPAAEKQAVPTPVEKDQTVHVSSIIPFCKGRLEQNNPYPMTESKCRDVTAKLQKVIGSNATLKRNLFQVVTSLGIKTFPCPLCNKTMGSPISMIEHAVSTGHLNKSFTKGKSFCLLKDYAAMVQLIGMACEDKTTITLQNADQMLARFGAMNIKLMTPPPADTGASGSSSVRSSASPEVQVPKPTPVVVPPPAPAVKPSTPSNSNVVEDLSSDDTEGSQSSVEVVDEVETQNVVGAGEMTGKESEISEVRADEPQSSTSVSADFDHPLCDVGVEATEENTSSSDDSDNCKTPTPASHQDVQEEQPPKLKTCLLSPEGRALRFLHQPSGIKQFSSGYLTETEIYAVASKVFAAYAPSRCLAVNVPCSTGNCEFIRPFCPIKCPVCSHSASCVCDYILHLFGSYHIKRIVTPGFFIEASHISFWLKVLKRLHPAIPFSSTLPENDLALSDLATSEYYLTNLADLRQICVFRKIKATAPLKYLNSDSLIPAKRLTGDQLRFASAKVNTYFNGCPCFCSSAFAVTSKLMKFIPKVCPLCTYESSCGCDYMLHLFRNIHLSALTHENIAVAPADVQWWVDHMRYLCHKSKSFTQIDNFLNDEQLWKGTGVKPECYCQEDFYIQGVPNMATSSRTVIAMSQISAARTPQIEKKQGDCVIC